MPFYPPDIPGLSLWLRPRHYPLLADGDEVNLWLDEAGDQVNLHQLVAGLGPTYYLNAVNGFPALEFNGTTQFMNGPDASSVFNTGAYALLASVFVTDTTTEQTIFSAGSDIRLWIESGLLKATNN